jgi:hypothetical protein
MTTVLLPALHAVLAPVAEPVRAPAMRAYMRDQFDYLGIPTPQMHFPRQPGHPFHAKLGTDSTANWTPIPAQTGH